MRIYRSYNKKTLEGSITNLIYVLKQTISTFCYPEKRCIYNATELEPANGMYKVHSTRVQVELYLLCHCILYRRAGPAGHCALTGRAGPAGHCFLYRQAVSAGHCTLYRQAGPAGHLILYRRTMSAGHVHCKAGPEQLVIVQCTVRARSL